MSTDHVIPRRVYYTVFGILLFCTYLTVQIAFFDLGPINTVAALGIAAFKATLVVLFFMHLRYSTTLPRAVVLASLLFVGILFSLTMADYLTRRWLIYG